MVTGNCGTSLEPLPGARSARSIGRRLPWTLGLVGVATVLAFLLGTARHRRRLAARRRGSTASLPPVFVVTSALPYFWVGCC